MSILTRTQSIFANELERASSAPSLWVEGVVNEGGKWTIIYSEDGPASCPPNLPLSSDRFKGPQEPEVEDTKLPPTPGSVGSLSSILREVNAESMESWNDTSMPSREYEADLAVKAAMVDGSNPSYEGPHPFAKLPARRHRSRPLGPRAYPDPIGTPRKPGVLYLPTAAPAVYSSPCCRDIHNHRWTEIWQYRTIEELQCKEEVLVNWVRAGERLIRQDEANMHASQKDKDAMRKAYEDVRYQLRALRAYMAQRVRSGTTALATP